MLFHNLILLLPAALLASAAPADSHSLADAGPPPALDSSPPGSLNSTDEEASADSAAASTCSDWYKLYGNNKWTYIEVQWCLRQGARETVVTQAQQNAAYYWGGAWYAGKTYLLAWRANGKVGSREFDSGVQSSDGAVKRDIYTYKPRIRPGTYPVSVHYHQVGPYWGEDAAIDVDLSFLLSVGN